MPGTPLIPGLKLFSTCPPSNRIPQADYLQRVQEIAQWSEQAGCEGILVYTDNSLLDPWLVSEVIINATRRLSPLVAIQPAYMHPYSAAKMVATFAYLHGRRLHLNMVAGGFRNDLIALNDPTPHDERYDRLVEYTTIIKALLRGSDALSYEGRYYRVANLKLTPALAPSLMPGVFVSGSSDAGMAAARKLSATAVQYPRPPSEYPPAHGDAPDSMGIRIGIIAREEDAEAWHVARTRFPEDRKGQLTHQLAMKVSDSSWHKQLSDLGNTPASLENPYWLVPFRNYKTFCPYLVGSYDRVADEVSRYVEAGYRTFILDVPASPEEMRHTGEVFERAVCAFAIG
jgi:alkanesulfonate monooxygenase